MNNTNNTKKERNKMKQFTTGFTIEVNVHNNIEAETEEEAMEILKGQIEDIFPMGENDTKHELNLFVYPSSMYIKDSEFAEEIEE